MGLHPAVAAVRRGVRRSLAGLEPGATVLVAGNAVFSASDPGEMIRRLRG